MSRRVGPAPPAVASTPAAPTAGVPAPRTTLDRVAPAPLTRLLAADQLESFLATETKAGRLVPTSYVARRSDGRRVKVQGVYRWNTPDFRPHMSFQLLKLLRNAYAEAPEQYGKRLFDQLDYVLSHSVERQGARVWENANGYVDAMVQAEYADFMVSLAAVYRRAGAETSVTACLRTAFALSRAMALEAGSGSGGTCTSGGVVGPEGATARAAFFHSRGGDAKLHPGTAMNQTAHALRDTAQTILALRKWSGPWLEDLPSREVLEQELSERLVSGLYQFAFAPPSTAASPPGAPNLQQYMARHEDAQGAFYTAFYEFDPVKQRGSDITRANTAHYHTHALDVLAGLFSLAEQTAFDPRVYVARDALLGYRSAAGEPEASGAEGSRNALYQWYLVARDPELKRRAGFDTPSEPAKKIPYFERAFGFAEREEHHTPLSLRVGLGAT